MTAPIKLETGTMVTLLLRAEHVQVILAAIGEIPHKLAKPVDDEIDRQLQEQFGAK